MGWLRFEDAHGASATGIRCAILAAADAKFCLRAGERDMVEIQSAWFPLIRRHPQKHVLNIFEAAASDSQNARQRICHSKEYPSNAELSVAAR